MWIHVPSTTCDVMSFFNGAEWRNLSNHNRMSTIQSRTPEKKAKNNVHWPKNFQENLVPLLTYISFHNPMILKLFLKTFPTKMKPTKCPAREKKARQEKQKKEGRRESGKSLLNPKTILKFCFLCMPELCKLILCIWIRRPWSVWPPNSFVVSFNSL